MRRLRHRLGRWLLRDAPRPTAGTVTVSVVPDVSGFVAKLREQLREV